ncbi:MAG TPA: acyclic terpene utilization AtuA family protein [Fimbriiglobus sp.]|jgi:hypothetical protein
MKTLRIGNGCGFWGDNVDAPVRLARAGRLDYLTLEYLAELTMSILALLRQRNPAAGYAHDFLDVLDRLGSTLKEQPNLKIVTNAGGMNPKACGEEAVKVLAKHGLTDRKVGVISGDDLLPGLDELIAAGHAFRHLDTGEPLAIVRSRVVSANAYLGARPIAEALRLGASVVITGRVADASLVVGPAMHEFGWAWDDWDKLGAATVAGHLIECGAQMTGGLWPNVTDAHHLENVGYPIAELNQAGGLRVTKPEGSGGAVKVETVSEQLLYEVADSAQYFTPDVVGDFTAPTLREVAKDVVEITGSKGKPATDTYKVSIAYRDGFTASGSLVIVGPNAIAKARRSGEILLARLKAAGHVYEHSYVEVLGGGDGVPGVLKPQADPPEVVLRVAVRDANKAAVERFTKEFAPLVTAGLIGTTGYTTGRPQVREVFAYWPSLVDKRPVEPKVEVLG